MRNRHWIDLQVLYDSVLDPTKNVVFTLGPNKHWTSNYGTGIVFIGNMLSWLSLHIFV